jgi:F-type H+-transporting ATPase subunit delta
MAATADFRAARRYAGALFNLARDRNELQPVAEGLNTVAQVSAASPELMTVLHHPRITQQRKKEILAHVFGGQVKADVEHLLLMMVEKDRAMIIPNVATQFNRLMDEYLRETDAEATSAIPLTPQQEAALLDRLQTVTGMRVRLKTRVDESILGGLVVRIGDKLIDASVASQLQRMKDSLKQAKVT